MNPRVWDQPGKYSETLSPKTKREENGDFLEKDLMMEGRKKREM